MGVTVQAWWYLLLAPWLLLLVFLVARRSLSGLEPGRRAIALTARSLVVLLLVVALAELDVTALAEPVDVVLAVDRSRSIPEDQAQVAERVAEAVRAGTSSRRTARLVAFGRDAWQEGALRQDELLPPFRSTVDREGTDLEVALMRALDVVAPSSRGRVLLATDGNETSGDVQDALTRARREGVVVDVLPLSYRRLPEVILEKVVVPPRADLDEPFQVRVVTSATAPTDAVLRVWRDGALVETRPVRLAEGTSVEVFDIANDRAGFARIEAAVEPIDREADEVPQNNVAYGFVHTPGRSSVLYVHDEADPARTPPLLGVLLAAGFNVRALSPSEVPLDQGGLQDCHAVVLDDVPRSAFSTRQVATLEAAVAQLGVGLVMIGGPDAFGAGEWARTPVEDALPVLMEPRNSLVVLSTALVLVIDRSGSMSGEKLEMSKAAAVAAASALGSNDRVGVVAFDDSADWIVPLAPAGDDARVASQVRALASGGGTALATGVRAAYLALRACRDVAVKHVIVLTDGRSEPGDHLDVAVRMRREGITLSCVGTGQDADDELLRTLARAGGGRHYDVDQPRDLPRVFVKETRLVARPLIKEDELQPAPRPGAPLLGSLDAFPPLGGLVVTEAKPRADVALTAPDGAPVLAGWQYGLGRSIAFTSDARPVWARAWVPWEGFATFWTQVVRWVSRNVDASTLTVSTSQEDGRGRVVVDAVDEAGELVDGLAVTAHVRGPEGADVTTPLRQSGSGRYEGDFPVEGRGTYEVTLIATHPSSRRREALTTGLVVPWSEEHRPLSSSDARLAELARSCGGRVLRPWDVIEGHVDPWDPEGLPSRTAPRETWPFALAAAVFVFLLDVAVRRVALPPRAPRPPAAPPATQGVEQRLSSLLAHVAERREARAASPESIPRRTTEPVAAPTPQAPGLPAGPAKGAADTGQSNAAGPSDVASPAAGPEASSSFTARLLEAKRRAKRGR